MSRVFVADETSLGRKVVIKVLPPELAAGVNVDRFKREIQVAARLQHPHIVPVLSAEVFEGLSFYTMPLVDGSSVRARLANGPLSITETVNILREVARALAYAHANGVVHRDIKPDLPGHTTWPASPTLRSRSSLATSPTGWTQSTRSSRMDGRWRGATSDWPSYTMPRATGRRPCPTTRGSSTSGKTRIRTCSRTCGKPGSDWASFNARRSSRKWMGDWGRRTGDNAHDRVSSLTPPSPVPRPPSLVPRLQFTLDSSSGRY